MDVRRAFVGAQLLSIAVALGAIACGSDGSSDLLGTKRERTGTASPDGGGTPYGGVIIPGADGSCPNDMTACSSVCVDTATDVGNCGACGTVCGGTCALGRCVVTLASGGVGSGGPGAIAVSGANVYYFSSTGLMSVPVAGGTPTTVAPVTGNAMAVSGTDIYWSTNSAIISQPLAGGAPTTIAPTGGEEIAVSPTAVYWTTNSTVMSAPLGAATADAGADDGGLDAGSDGSAPTTLAVGQNDPFGLAVGAAGVYWTNGGTLSGSGGFAPATGTIARFMLSGAAAAADAGTDDAGADGGGPTGPLTMIATAQNYPHGIAADGANVYWAASGTNATRFADGAIMSAPLGGIASGATPTTLATAQPFPYAVAVDSATLYWTCNDNGGTSGGVMSVSLGGGTPVPLAKGQSSPTAIAVDDTSVYWMTGSGALMKLTPK